MDDLGNQRVGIVRTVPKLDGNGQPVMTDMQEVDTAELVVWVDGASFELQNQTSPATSERQSVTETTTSNVAWAFLPVVDGQVPALDDDDEPVLVPVDDITSKAALRYRSADYQLRGDAQLMEDYDGVENHVFCLAERQAG
jgi:hypothetical protein